MFVVPLELFSKKEHSQFSANTLMSAMFHPLSVPLILRGCIWSQLLGERWDTPWIGRQSITELKYRLSSCSMLEIIWPVWMRMCGCVCVCVWWLFISHVVYMSCFMAFLMTAAGWSYRCFMLFYVMLCYVLFCWLSGACDARQISVGTDNKVLSYLIVSYIETYNDAQSHLQIRTI